jgi:hypothetical protein
MLHNIIRQPHPAGNIIDAFNNTNSVLELKNGPLPLSSPSALAHHLHTHLSTAGNYITKSIRKRPKIS